MREVSVRIGRRRYPLVDLNDMYMLPGQLLIGQDAQHHPGGVAATHRHDEASARKNRSARIRSNDCRPAAGHRLVITLDFDLHATSSDPGFTIGIATREH
jgi:hypothetical protein